MEEMWVGISSIVYMENTDDVSNLHYEGHDSI